jgi:hypothetical protein
MGTICLQTPFGTIGGENLMGQDNPRRLYRHNSLRPLFSFPRPRSVPRPGLRDFGLRMREISRAVQNAVNRCSWPNSLGLTKVDVPSLHGLLCGHSSCKHTECDAVLQTVLWDMKSGNENNYTSIITHSHCSLHQEKAAEHIPSYRIERSMSAYITSDSLPLFLDVKSDCVLNT